MARPVTVGRTSVAPCGKTIWGISMTTDNPLISIYMPTWNRQQLAIRAIKSVLRQDYRHWEMIIVDDCSSSYQQLQQFVEELNDPRVRYTHNAMNTGACAVRNQAIMQAQGHYITGIDDDDEWTPNRLSVFLAHKHQLTTHAFLYANDYVCEGEVYSQPASLPACRCIRNLLIRAAYSTSAILLAIRFLPGPGVLKRVCSIPNSRRRRITTFFCAWWWSMANRGKSKRRRKFYISTTARCRLPLRRKSSPAISIFIVSTKINSIAPVKNTSFLPCTKFAISE